MRYTEADGIELQIGDGSSTTGDFSGVYINFAQTQELQTHEDVTGAVNISNSLLGDNKDYSQYKLCHDYIRSIAVENNIDKDETFLIQNRNEFLIAVLVEGDKHAKKIKDELETVNDMSENKVLKELYDQLMEKASDRFNGISGESFQPLPFKEGDTIGFKVILQTKEKKQFEYWVQIRLTGATHQGPHAETVNIETFVKDLDATFEQYSVDNLNAVLTTYLEGEVKTDYHQGEFPTLDRLRTVSTYDYPNP